LVLAPVPNLVLNLIQDLLLIRDIKTKEQKKNYSLDLFFLPVRL
jgi:hypothetical protein